MILNQYDYCMVIDLEATCCDQDTVPRREMEMIEIGAVMANMKTLNIISEFQTFIKPIRHPILTEFCISLTSISQTQVNSAPSYPEAVNLLQSWFKVYQPLCWGSWGDYDRKQFQQDSDFHQVNFPIGCPHFNLKKLFSKNQNLKGRYGMAQALKLTEIPLVGTHHRGIDDARNIAKLMPYILGIEKLNHENLSI
jgi:inhibitor of KinA sporulation pathway (predicted exonuclease)